MTPHSVAVPRDNRYFEDYTPGHVYEFGALTVSEVEIVDFARQFDPQYFHIDPEMRKPAGLVKSSPRVDTRPAT